MKGLELSKLFYENYGKAMLENEFSEILPNLAVGLVGSGSECFGFDDEISIDHDFEPAFCIFVPDDIDATTLFKLERAYAKLPKEFMGYSRCAENPVGGSRHGVIKIGDFLRAKTGKTDTLFTAVDWFTISENSLAEATNGEIFFDNFGEVTEIREKLKFYPEDIRLKKIAGNLVLSGQSGQYNYERCIKRGDTAAAQLSVIEFVKSAVNVIFLLNKTYQPYYKWCFLKLGQLEKCADLNISLEYLISSDNNKPQDKIKVIEDVCARIVAELKNQDLTSFENCEMEAQGYMVNSCIKDNLIRNMNILSAI